MASINLPQSSGGEPSSYLESIRADGANPERVEQLYQDARSAGELRPFAAAIATLRAESPENLLYGAWYYRLRQPATEPSPGTLAATWSRAVPISIVLAAALWLLSAPSLILQGNMPLLVLLIAPLVGLALVVFLATRRHALDALLAGLVLVGLAGYVLAIASSAGAARLQLVALHLPLLAWGAIGLAVLGWRSAGRERFAFLTKSIEAIGTGGVFGIAGGIFAGITLGLFQALSVALPDPLIRLLASVVGGIVPLFAVAAVYDPTQGPLQQEFGRGFGRILTVILRVLLVLSVGVLLIYLAVIPFNFWAPFTNRDLLIIYNLMLFAVMGLLIGVTPLTTADLSPRLQAWLRAGIIVVAVLVTLVSLYALSATLYRTISAQDLTMNRATILGWNVVNIGILLSLLYRQLRPSQSGWATAIQSVIAGGAIAYVAWAAVVALVIPWLF